MGGSRVAVGIGIPSEFSLLSSLVSDVCDLPNISVIVHHFVVVVVVVAVANSKDTVYVIALK
jgi:hypothetical protein